MPVLDMAGNPVDNDIQLNVPQALEAADLMFKVLRQDAYDRPEYYRRLRLGGDTVRSILYRIMRNVKYIEETSKLR